MTQPTAAAMTDEEIIALLIERGPDGVPVLEVAARDPAGRQHNYDFTYFDEEPSDHVIDLGERGPSDPVVYRHAAARLAGLVRHRGAVLATPEDRPGRAADLANGRSGRVVLEGWSGLPPVGRSLPLAEERGLPPVDAVAAFLRAAGPSGAPRCQVAWWSPPPGASVEESPYMDVTWAAAVSALRERGWDIRTYWGLASGDTWVQAAAVPGEPMRAPADVPPVPLQRHYGWPRRSYRYAPDLFGAIAGARASIHWMNSGDANPLPSYRSPSWFGQPVPDGEDDRRALVRWATEHDLTSVIRLAVPGSVELVLEEGEPVGLEEIAQRLHVQRGTVDRWRQRCVLPQPAWTVGGRPAWAWTAIEQWARDTGRLPRDGTPS
jgi:hypothetical protein